MKAGRDATTSAPPEETTVDGIRYAAVSYMTARGLVTELTVTNTSAVPFATDRWLARCPVNIRLFRESSRSGAPVFDVQDVEVCPKMPEYVALSPGETRRFSRLVPLARIPESLRPGTYFVTATVLFVERDVSAGEVSLPP